MYRTWPISPGQFALLMLSSRDQYINYILQSLLCYYSGYLYNNLTSRCAIYLFIFILLFWVRVSVCSLGSPGTLNEPAQVKFIKPGIHPIHKMTNINGVLQTIALLRGTWWCLSAVGSIMLRSWTKVLSTWQTNLVTSSHYFKMLALS